MALALGVAFPVGVNALISKPGAPVPVIAVIAHTFGKVLQIRVLAVCYISDFTPDFYLTRGTGDIRNLSLDFD